MRESTTTARMTLLGTGTSMGVPMIGCDCEVCTSTNPRNQRLRTGVLVQAPEGNFLIDTPPELRIQLIRERVDELEAAIFTHAHADHILGLDDLRIFGFKRNAPVRLYCEPAVEKQLRTSFNYAFAPPEERNHQHSLPQLEFCGIAPAPFDLLGLQVRPFRVWHGGTPVLGFRLGNVAFCTDCKRVPDESLPELADLEVLIIDALWWEGEHPTHFNVPEALALIDLVKPRRAYLTHISHRLEHVATNARLPDGVELAYDGLQISISH